MTADEALLAWLREGLAELRQRLPQFEITGIDPRVLMDWVKADEALVAEHTADDKPWCSRCEPERDALGEPLTGLGPCRTLVIIATRYRHVLPGWRWEWTL